MAVTVAIARVSMAKHGEAWRSVVKRGEAWRSVAKRGEAWRACGRGVARTVGGESRAAVVACLADVHMALVDKHAKLEDDPHHFDSLDVGRVRHAIGPHVDDLWVFINAEHRAQLPLILRGVK